MTLESRAHGASAAGAERPFSFAMLADDVLAFADAQRVGRFVAGGISMGAGLALRLAVQHPARVGAMVLARPAWLFDPAPSNMSPYAAIGAALHAASPEKARTHFLRSSAAMNLAEIAPATLEALMHWFEGPDLAATADLLTDIAGGGPGVSRAEAAALQLPVLVIGHDGDPAHPLAVARELADVIPGATLVEVPPKGGPTKEQHLRELRDAVTHFLRERLDATA